MPSFENLGHTVARTNRNCHQEPSQFGRYASPVKHLAPTAMAPPDTDARSRKIEGSSFRLPSPPSSSLLRPRTVAVRPAAARPLRALYHAGMIAASLRDARECAVRIRALGCYRPRIRKPNKGPACRSRCLARPGRPRRFACAPPDRCRQSKRTPLRRRICGNHATWCSPSGVRGFAPGSYQELLCCARPGP